jgi:N-acyl-D-amino-acid deacylase
MAAMHKWLAEALEVSALGLSTGLVYEPSRYAQTEEIVELAREMRKHRGIYTSHMRNEAGGLLNLVRETIRVGDQAVVPVRISHHKASGRENRGRVRDSFGSSTTHAHVAWTSAPISILTPRVAPCLRRLAKQRPQRAPEQVLVASEPRHPDYEGGTIGEFAECLGSPEQAANRIVAEEGASSMVVLEIIDEADVRT